MAGYRVKRLRIPAQRLIQLAVAGTTSRCLGGLPEGTTFAGAAAYDPNDHQVEILVTHPSFPEVPGDEIVPECGRILFTRLD